MTSAVIVSAARTAVGKAPRGALRTTRPEEMAAAAVRAVMERAPAVDAADIDDVIMGCAMPEAEQGMNVARIASLRAGLPVEVPAQTVNRFCSSGLQTIALAAQQIMSGMGETRHRRRRGNHVDGADEQQQIHGQPDAGQGASRRLHRHGVDCGEPGAPV